MFGGMFEVTFDGMFGGRFEGTCGDMLVVGGRVNEGGVVDKAGGWIR